MAQATYLEVHAMILTNSIVHVAFDILVHQKCPSIIVKPFILLYIQSTGLMVLLAALVTQLIQSA